MSRACWLGLVLVACGTPQLAGGSGGGVAGGVGGGGSGGGSGVDAGLDAGEGLDAGGEDAGPRDAGAGARAFALDDGVDAGGIDGLSIRLGWGQLEQTEGTYTWSTLDQRLGQVKAVGKHATLHLAGSVFPGATPGWLADAGVQFYSVIRGTPFSDAGTMVVDVVPWDPVFFSKWSAIIRALSQHLADAGELEVVENVSLTAPVPEMNLVSCAKGFLDGKSIPYERASYLATWQKMIDLYAEVFPAQQKFLSAPQNGICGLDGDTAFYSSLLTYALAKDSARFEMFAADLSATGSARVAPYLSLGARVAFQPVAAVTDDPRHWTKGTLLQLNCAGLALGADYIEVYAHDLKSTDPQVQLGVTALHHPSLCP